MRGPKAAATKTNGDKSGGGQGTTHVSARSASHGGSKGLGINDPNPPAVDDYSLLKLSTSAAPSPRSIGSAPGSGAASPLATLGGGNAYDPDTPKSRLLHSVMGALEAYAADSPRQTPHLQQQEQPPLAYPPHHHHHLHQPSSASSSPARARGGELVYWARLSCAQPSPLDRGTGH